LHCSFLTTHITHTTLTVQRLSHCLTVPKRNDGVMVHGHVLYQNTTKPGASRVVQLSRGVTTDPGSIPGCVAASSDRETHEAVHNWPSLGDGLAVWDLLVPLLSSDSLCRAGRTHADFGRQLSSDTLVRLASGLSEQCVKKQCSLARSCFEGRIALDLCLSESVRETVTTNWISQNWGE
jgi:hypothetical protein